MKVTGTLLYSLGEDLLALRCAVIVVTGRMEDAGAKWV